MKEHEILNRSRQSRIVAGRNIQRAIFGDLILPKKNQETRVINNMLDTERALFYQMRLTNEQLGEIKVNPDLTTFLDGQDGMGGYADTYAQQEYMAPGTKLEMDIERRIIQQHLLSILTPDYLQSLRRIDKPLVITEGGAGPDLRTFEIVCKSLSEKKADLIDIPIKIIITDISKRMAAITASKIQSSMIIDADLNIESAVIAADVFELLEKLSGESLSYALLPFGVLSFGLNGKDPHQILETINKKLIRGGGTLITVYHSGWLDYLNQLNKIINQSGNHNNNSLQIKDLVPFVIDIKNNKMQVADGLAFNCRTFYPQQLVNIVQSSGLAVDEPVCTPAGWAYWPKEILTKAVEGRIYPQGCPVTPPPYLMDIAKQKVLDKVVQTEGGDKLLQQLSCLIPDGDQITKYPAPYITLTAKKTNY